MTSILRGTVVVPSSFHSRVVVNLEGTNVDELYNTMVARILENIATFQMRGSQWTFSSIISVAVHTVKYEPLRGSTYIPLPKSLSSKKAISSKGRRYGEFGYQAVWPRHGYQAVFLDDVIGRTPHTRRP